MLNNIFLIYDLKGLREWLKLLEKPFMYLISMFDNVSCNSKICFRKHILLSFPGIKHQITILINRCLHCVQGNLSIASHQQQLIAVIGHISQTHSLELSWNKT